MMHRIAVALTWAFGTATLVFLVMFATPLVIGGPGAHQAPLLAFILTPIIFVITLALTLIWPRLGLVAIVACLLFPAWYYVKMPPRDSRASTLVPLSDAERALVRSRHFEARVAVDGGKAYPIYREQLINDLRQTGLFSLVTPVEETPSAELIAIVTGSYYGDKTGHSFSLSQHQSVVLRVRWSLLLCIEASSPSRTLCVRSHPSDGCTGAIDDVSAELNRAGFVGGPIT
jgi:hypothetical protein